jgi:hypothetical protein
MNRWKKYRGQALALIAAAMALAGGLCGGQALAERSIQIGQAKRTATVTVYIGKTKTCAPIRASSSLRSAIRTSPTSIR